MRCTLLRLGRAALSLAAFAFSEGHPLLAVTRSIVSQAAVIACDDPVALDARRFRGGTQVLLPRVDVR